MNRKSRKKSGKSRVLAKTKYLLFAVGILLFLGVVIVTASLQQPTDDRTQASSNVLYPVPHLPSDNLIVNPWFADNTCVPKLEPWVSVPNQTNHQWTASNKPSNPTSPSGCDTAGRISVGESDGENGATVQPNQDVKLYQIVSANPSHRYLVFDMYWVLHTANTAKVTVYGSNQPDPNGNWTQVWVPFNYSEQNQIIPPAGVGQRQVWLWQCYSEATGECADAPKLPATAQISTGYAYYKIELMANLPPVTGGYKQTGIYFAARADGSQTPPVATPPATPPGATAEPSVKPSATPTSESERVRDESLIERIRRSVRTR